MDVEGQSGELYHYPQGSGNVHANQMSELTNPEPSIILLREAITGIRLINGKEVTVGDQLLNQDGVNSVISQLRSLVNQVSILSFLDDSEIRMLVHDQFGRSLIKDLMINRKKYNIEKPSDRSKIVTMSQSVAFSTLKRALKGNDKNFWSRVMMEFNTNVSGGKEDTGIMGKMNIFRNR